MSQAKKAVVPQKMAAEMKRLYEVHNDLLRALKALTQWLDDSGLSGTGAGGVGPFAYESTEYSVVKDARAAIKKAESK